MAKYFTQKYKGLCSILKKKHLLIVKRIVEKSMSSLRFSAYLRTMAQLKCIIFDCDGVLVDTETTSFRVLGDCFKSIGYEAPIAQMQIDFSGTSLGACIAYVEQLHNIKVPEGFIPNFRTRSFEAFKNEVTPIAHIHQLLNELKLPFCVASSSLKEKIILNLTLAKLIHFFEGKIYSAYDIQEWKPDPGVFLYAAKGMGFRPDECLVIEDSVSGLTAASRGGFPAIGYAEKEHHVKLLQKMNVPIIRDMLEANSYIKKILNAHGN